MKKAKAMLMDVQRYSIHDGPGIRTTVFLKGCHMVCKWCHNPESQHPEAEMLFYEEQCVNCMSCVSLCDRKAHRVEDGIHKMDLAVCRNCPKLEICAQNCPSQAMRLCGQEMDTTELLDKVLADRDFYGEEGGVTFSGGEPLLQDDFLAEFLPLCKKNGISTCVDTTLNVEWERVEKLLPFIDLFLVDIKFMDEDNHKKYTGIDGKLTVENLRRLSERNKPVILRMPLIAQINDTDQEAADRRKLLEGLSNVQRVDCFAVTNHGAAKYKALQRKMVLFNQDTDLQKLVENMQTGKGML